MGGNIITTNCTVSVSMVGVFFVLKSLKIIFFKKEIKKEECRNKLYLWTILLSLARDCFDMISKD